jgi:glycogen operon protein
MNRCGPLHETIIYEVHVKGFSKRFPDIPDALRGTYAGLAHPAAIDYLTALGVTAVELLPIHQFVHDSFLLDRGLRNYWGYNSVGFFAPHNEYANDREPGASVREFKAMVKALHAAGLEVILDVVYNHTAEGTISVRCCRSGLDNTAYYRTVRHAALLHGLHRHGQHLNMRHPQALQLAMDSLRYWVTEMHVDGFRFDLAATLARGVRRRSTSPSSTSSIRIRCSTDEAIAEPWDIGHGGYQVGNFPVLWSEWNGKFRDSVRDWRSQDAAMAEFASRLTGSPTSIGRRPAVGEHQLHHRARRSRCAIWSPQRQAQRGERRGESRRREPQSIVDRRRGADRRRGDQRDARAAAAQPARDAAAVTGAPMPSAATRSDGRKAGTTTPTVRTTRSPGWIEHVDEDLLEFTRRLIAFRSEHPVFHRRGWFKGRQIRGKGVTDIAWFQPDGSDMSSEEWGQWFAKSFAVFLFGEGLLSRDERGRPEHDASFLFLANAHTDVVQFTARAPSARGGRWRSTRWTAVSA